MAVEKVVVTKSKLDNLAEIISSKSEEPIPLTIDEMSAAVLDLNLVNNQNNKTVTPTIDEQTVTPDEPYTGLDSVTVEAISPVRSQEDLSVNGPYVDVPKGWYPQSVWGQVGPGSLETPSFNRTNYTDHVVLTPIVNVSQSGYILATSSTGTSVTISASNVTNGTKSITQNGTFDVTNYKNASVNVPAPTPTALTITPTTSQQDFSDGPYNPVTVSSINIQPLEATPSSETQVFNAIEKQLLTKLTTSQGKYSINLQLSNSTNPISIGDTIYVSGYLLQGSGSIKDISKTIVVSSDQTQSYYVSLNSSRRVNITLFRISSGTYSLNIALEDNSGNQITNQYFYIKENPDFDNTNTVGVFKDTKIADGYLPVTVNPIPSEYIIPEGTLEVTQNGTVDVTQYASATVSVPSSAPTLQSKTITPTESQQTVSPDSGYDALSSVTVDAISSTYVGSGIEQRDETDLTASGETVTVPSGYYAEQETKTVASGSATAPATIMGGSGATVGRNSSGVISLVKTVSITPTVTPGYISTGTAGDSQIILSTQGTVVQKTTYTPTTSDQTIFNSGIHYFEGAQKVAGDSKLIAENIKKDIDIFGVTGTYEGIVINNQDKSFTPDETGSIITPDEGYTGLGSVTVDAIPSTYVGTGITRRSSSDLTAPLNTVTVPAGYYAEDASKTISNGSVTVTTAKGNVVSNSVKVFGSVTYTQGFIGSGSQNDSTGIIIHASDLVSGNKAITQNGTDIDVTKYATVSVNVQPTLQSKTVTPTESSQTIAPDTGYDGMDEVTVDAISSSYVGSGIDRRSSSDLAVSGATVTVPAGYYATAVSASVASGSASTPATSITANPTISVSSSGLITASVSASQNVTPTVSAGYVSSGTAGTVSVSGSKTQQLTTKAAATITPGTTNQTIAAGTYLTGTQTIAGDADLVAGNIKAGVQIFGVTGNLSFITYYTGSSDPSSSLGSNGDIYLKVA